MVYDKLGLDILDNSMNGYNACIFAYGQTGNLFGLLEFFALADVFMRLNA